MNTYVDIPYQIDTETNEEKQYKDINEWLCKTDKSQFKENLEMSIYNKYDKEYMFSYMDDFCKDLQLYASRPTKSTGFKILDEQLNGGIRGGLYVLGAIPSLRKNNLFFTNGR